VISLNAEQIACARREIDRQLDELRATGALVDVLEDFGAMAVILLDGVEVLLDPLQVSRRARDERTSGSLQ
jgi:hypothetical protein